MFSKILLDWCCKYKQREMRHPSKTQWLNLLWWPFLLADNFWRWFQSRKMKFRWWERWIKSKSSSKSYSSCYWDRTSRADWSPHKMFRNVSFLKVLLQLDFLMILVLQYSIHHFWTELSVQFKGIERSAFSFGSGFSACPLNSNDIECVLLCVWGWRWGQSNIGI